MRSPSEEVKNTVTGERKIPLIVFSFSFIASKRSVEMSIHVHNWDRFEEDIAFRYLAVTDLTKALEAREAGLLYYICQNSHYMLSCYPRFLRLRIRLLVRLFAGTYCTSKNYFESRVKIPLRKPVTKSQTWRF